MFFSRSTRRALRRVMPSSVRDALLAKAPDPDPRIYSAEMWRERVETPCTPEYPGAPATETVQVEFRRVYADPTFAPERGLYWQLASHIRPWRGLRLAKVLGLFTCDEEGEWLRLFKRRQDIANFLWEIDPQGVIPRDYRGGMGRVKWRPELLPEQDALPGLYERLETDGLILPPTENRQFLLTATDAETERLGLLPDTLEALVRYAALPPSLYLAVEALTTELRARLRPWWAQEEGPLRDASVQAAVAWSSTLLSHGRYAPHPALGWPEALRTDTSPYRGLPLHDYYEKCARAWPSLHDGPNPYEPLIEIMGKGCAVEILDPHRSRLAYPPLNAVRHP